MCIEIIFCDSYKRIGCGVFTPNKILEKSLERWKNCYPDRYLTWGKMITGHAFVELAQKYCNFTSAKRILELGPGYGRILASLLYKKIPFEVLFALPI